MGSAKRVLLGLTLAAALALGGVVGATGASATTSAAVKAPITVAKAPATSVSVQPFILLPGDGGTPPPPSYCMTWQDIVSVVGLIPIFKIGRAHV